MKYFPSSIPRRAAFQVIVLFSISALTSFAEESAQERELKPLRLGDLANQKLSDDQHGFQGNNLAKLPVGEHPFLGITFRIDAGVLALAGNLDPEKPKKIEGIKVDSTAVKLHFLHGTGYGAYGKAGEALFVTDDTVIGKYVVHYADKTSTEIPIVYGQDVRDWWTWGKPAEVTKGQVAWTGTNAFSEENAQKIHLYLKTWENPKPGLKILTIDYASTATSSAAPFCAGITVEK